MDYLEQPQLSYALDFARMSLAGQKRKSGEDIVDHCIKVADNLQKFKITDPDTLTVALLHHSLHEGAANMSDIRKEFGEEIASMLDAFEKLRIIKPKAKVDDEFNENLRKVFLILAKDLRVVLIKFADILDNLTTLQFVDQNKRVEMASKALDVFSPLAERLGMGEVRGQMQDMAFMHLHPQEYTWVKKISQAYLIKSAKYMPKARAKLITALEKAGIEATVQSRIKHIYSLYVKLQRPEINKVLDKVYDLMAMRIIVTSEEDCYKALGVITQVFPPLPEKVSDFIAHPKPNGYRSIHLKVLGPNNYPLEIQIRTKKMHEEAEYGVAAHWHYAEQKEKVKSDEKVSQGFRAGAEKLEWVKQLAEWQKELGDSSEFLKTLKTDFFGERIFCFTPKGDVKDLPKGATPIDFAYLVHTDMGDLVTGAKVNGKVVSLDTKLNNADVVELILSKDLKKKPSRDWLKFVVTSLAKREIKKACA